MKTYETCLRQPGSHSQNEKTKTNSFSTQRPQKTTKMKNIPRTKNMPTCYLKVLVVYLHLNSPKHEYSYLLKKQCLHNLKAVLDVCQSNFSHLLKLQKMVTGCTSCKKEGKLPTVTVGKTGGAWFAKLISKANADKLCEKAAKHQASGVH
ncbi:unnamed protein product [Lepidochelys kempii]